MGHRDSLAGKGPGEPWALSLISQTHVVQERIDFHKLPADLHRCLSPNKKALGMRWREMTLGFTMCTGKPWNKYLV